jgi:spore maturation protein CgeB
LINLIPQNYDYAITKRVFEILCSGGFGISYNTPAMRETFPEGSGIVTTSSQNETLELVRYYQHDIEAYKKVRQKALIDAQAHTYKQRAQTIINCVLKESKTGGKRAQEYE